MKFSELWLREWVNPAIDSDALANQITMAGICVSSNSLNKAGIDYEIQ